MKEIYLYLLLGVFLYFLFTRVLERFSNNISENFDPSLVPVSSIVTLAKVAQKLVNGNGTLTNPGHLQIGARTETPGNLTVTGGTIINGAGAPGGISLNVTGPTNIAGTLGVTGATTVSSLGVTGETTVNTLGVAGGLTVGSSTNAQTIKSFGPVDSNSLIVGPGSIQFNGPVTAGAAVSVGTNLTVGGTSTVTGNSTVTGVITASGAVGTATGGQIQVGSWGGVPAIYANDNAKSLAIHNDGTGKNVQIGFSSSYPNSLTVTGNTNIDGIMFDAAGQFRLVLQGGGAGGKCLTANTDDSINLQSCGTSDNQYWFRSGGRFISKSNKKCITITVDRDVNNDGTITKLMPINPTNGYQVFTYTQTANIISNMLGGGNKHRTMWGRDDGTINWWTWGIGSNGSWWMS